MRSLTRDLLVVLFVAFAIFLLLHYVLGSYTIVGTSMEPNLRPEMRVLVSKLAYRFAEPQRGDIVYYRSLNSEADRMKRVIALPGDEVEIHDGAVYINGNKLSEPYVRVRPNYTLDSYLIPPLSYFVLGDNRNNSSDSSSDWSLPRENVIGRAWVITWPPSDWGDAGNYQLDLQTLSASHPR